jgi:hypothetical protein
LLIAFDKGLRRLLDAEVAGGGMGGTRCWRCEYICHNGLTPETEGQTIIAGNDLGSTRDELEQGELSDLASILIIIHVNVGRRGDRRVCCRGE